MRDTPLQTYLFETYREDESCIAILSACFDALADSETSVKRVIADFAAAADSRSTSVSEVIRLIESAPAGRVQFPPDWDKIKSALMSSIARGSKTPN